MEATRETGVNTWFEGAGVLAVEEEEDGGDCGPMYERCWWWCCWCWCWREDAVALLAVVFITAEAGVVTACGVITGVANTSSDFTFFGIDC